MTPPNMAAWNLTLRFGLEVAALVGLGIAAWTLTNGYLRWPTVVIIPTLAATVWGVFNVLDDPSRSGEAPVEVSGWVRLTIELAILGGGAAAYALTQRPTIALTMTTLIAIHYATSLNRIEWLVQA